MDTAIQSIDEAIRGLGLSTDMKAIAEKVMAGDRISSDEGELLFEEGELGFLGALADHICRERHGDIVYFNRNFHIEPTNICVCDCKF